MKEYNRDVGEINDLPDQFNKTNDSEFNDEPSESQTFYEDQSVKSEENSYSPDENGEEPLVSEKPSSYSETANRAVKSKSAFVSKIAGYTVAVVGTAAVVATGVVKIRRDDAKFIKVYSEGESVVMIVEVNKWSKDLRIRVTDGDKIDYVYIEPRYDEEYPAREYYDNYYSERESDGEYYYYYAENAGEGRKIVVELVGDKVFLNDVLDRAEVEVKGYDYYSDPNEEYSGGESSDESGNDATYGDEGSNESGNDATYGGESSNESGGTNGTSDDGSYGQSDGNVGEYDPTQG